MRYAIAVLVAIALPLGACGDTDDGDQTTGSITVMTHDSFNVSQALLDGFLDETGIEVEVLPAGDAGAALNQAILTKENPQGDVFFGVDNTFLTRALDEDLFVRYESPGLDTVDRQFVVDDEHRVTPVDYGDVCLNYDKEFFTAEGVAVPQTLDDLTLPEYRDLLVVENPATSSPGLAFLLATVDRFGEDGYLDYWADLRANGVHVSEGWEDAYYAQFSGGAGEGSRPLVVSYASSPPAEVVFADPPLSEAPTGVIDDGCFRQIEFAGVLQGAANPDGARHFIDFLLSTEFQEDMPLNMFVFPVSTEAELPDAFAQHAVIPTEPVTVDPEEIGENRDRWIEEWTETVIR
ncbi:MAG: thiamine ABC transporter substrate-binding protein [Acidimicrobiales bacterium]